MKVLLHSCGEGRELDVPEPTNEEKELLLKFAIRTKLKQCMLGIKRKDARWGAAMEQIKEWGNIGYYPQTPLSRVQR